MEFTQVSSRYPTYLRVHTWIDAFLTLGVIAVLSYFIPWLTLLLTVSFMAAIVVLALVVTFYWIPRKFRFTGYYVDADQIQLRRGALWRTTQAVSINRVQHSEITQGPIERAFGLARLVIYTAGGAGADISIPGLPQDIATELKARVLKQVIQEPTEQVAHDHID